MRSRRTRWGRRRNLRKGATPLRLQFQTPCIFSALHEEFDVTIFDTGLPVDHGDLRKQLGPDVQIQGGPRVALLRKGAPDDVYNDTERILQSGVIDRRAVHPARRQQPPAQREAGQPRRLLLRRARPRPIRRVNATIYRPLSVSNAPPMPAHAPLLPGRGLGDGSSAKEERSRMRTRGSSTAHPHPPRLRLLANQRVLTRHPLTVGEGLRACGVNKATAGTPSPPGPYTVTAHPVGQTRAPAPDAAAHE